MNSGDKFVVTKIESVEGGYRVTAKDADTSKAKRRNVSSVVDDATRYRVGMPVTLKLEG
jgi:hypothetical protein